MASKFSAFKKGRAPKIAILGSLALDTNNRGSHSKKMYGGAVTYCGLTLAKLGAEVFVFSSSKNKHCPVLKQHTKLQFIESETDTEFINTEFENGSRDQKVSSISAPIPIAILEALSEMDWIHFGPLHPRDFTAGLILEAKKNKAIKSLDIQGYTRRIENGKVSAQFYDPILKELNALDWIKADKSEAVLLQNAMSPEKLITHPDILRQLNLEGLLITDSVRGGTLYSNSKPWNYEAEIPKKTVFETGAGDVFFACFIASQLGLIDKEACPKITAQHVAGDWINPDILER